MIAELQIQSFKNKGHELMFINVMIAIFLS